MDWLVNIVLLFLVFFLLFLLSMVWPPDSPWAPWWRTNRKIARAACSLAKVTSKDVVYELGCGEGTFLYIAAKEFGAQGVGIEIDPLRVLLSTLIMRITRMSDKVIIKRKNFFDQDLSEATVVYVYLVPKTLNRLLPKLKKELKPGTKLISLKYEMNLPLLAYDQTSKLYLYKL